MTLLAFMSTAEAPPPACATLPDLMNAIAARFPNALLMPTAVVPPRTTRPWAEQDWLTVPPNMPLAERAMFLVTAARWFEATVVLFLGSDTKGEYEAFVSPLGCSKFLWDGEVWWSNNEQLRGEGFSDPLFAVLEARLPLICSIKEITNEKLSQTYRASRKPECPLWVYLRKPLVSTEASALTSLATSHPKSVHLKVSLRMGLATVAGLLQLRRLLKSGPPLRFTIQAENTLFASSADAMTKLLALGAGAGVQAVLAPRDWT